MGLGNVRYFYRTEGRRRVTVAYRYDPETGNTSYGASIFRQDYPGEIYVKREHRLTAEGRLAVSPVRIRLEAASLSEVENLIRRAILVYSVRGPRLINDGRLTVPKSAPKGAVVCFGFDPNWPGKECYTPFSGEIPVKKAESVQVDADADLLSCANNLIADLVALKSLDLD